MKCETCRRTLRNRKNKFTKYCNSICDLAMKAKNDGDEDLYEFYVNKRNSLIEPSNYKTNFQKTPIKNTGKVFFENMKQRKIKAKTNKCFNKTKKNKVHLPKSFVTKDFYNSSEWLQLRYAFLRTSSKICMLCGSYKKPIHVDHIKPKSIYPHLALDINNLQILCAQCNKGKSNIYEDDWR